MECYLSQVMLWSMPWAPEGWAICDGRLLPISQYTLLFSLIGSKFGGDGRSSFALPDLRGSLPIGAGMGLGLGNTYQLGERYGAEYYALQDFNLPVHKHQLNPNLNIGINIMASTDDATSASPFPGCVLGKVNTNAKDEFGGDAIADVYIEKTEGEFDESLTELQSAWIIINSKPSMNTGMKGQERIPPIGNIPPVLAMNYIMLIDGGEYPVKPS